jgi:hypothetical protein
VAQTEEQERLAAIEQRLAVLEQLAARGQELFEQFASGPGRKLLAMMGVKP